MLTVIVSALQCSTLNAQEERPLADEPADRRPVVRPRDAFPTQPAPIPAEAASPEDQPPPPSLANLPPMAPEIDRQSALDRLRERMRSRSTNNGEAADVQAANRAGGIDLASDQAAAEEEQEEMLRELVIVDMDGPSLLKMLEDLTEKHVLSAQNLPTVKINFEMRTELTKSEAILAVESLLTLNGIAITEIGGKFLKAVPAQTIGTQVPIFLEGPAADLQPSQQIYSKLYTFDYLSVANGEVQPLLQPILSQQGQSIVPFNKSNSMLITDSLVNLQRVERIMAEADSPEPVDEDTIHFFQIKYVKASDLKSRLDSMINNTLRQYLQNNTSVEFDERTNQLIVVTHKSNLPLIERMIASLDIDIEPSTTSKVFYIKHAKAEEVDQLLEEVIQGQQQQKNDRNSNNNNRTEAAVQPTTGNAPNTPPVPPPPAVSNNNGSAGNESGENLQFSEFITIVADERSNAIIVYGTHSDIRQVTRLIDDIDVLLPQVKIRVLIAEITLDRSDGSGINRLGLTHSLNLSGASGSEKQIDIGGPGFSTSMNLRNGDFNLVLQAVNRDSNAKILSNPEIVTTHNQEASINVSESRPIITGTTTSTVNADTTSSTVQYRDIGIQLKVTPLIGSSGIIQLEIEQTVENILGEIPVDGNDQPIIGKKEAVTFISVDDGDVVILGGLQSRDISTSREGLFLLSDLPFIGDLFSGHSSDDQRRELMIFIQPQVINNRADAQRQLEEKLNTLEGGPMIRNVIEDGDMKAFDFEDRWQISRPLHLRPKAKR